MSGSRRGGRRGRVGRRGFGRRGLGRLEADYVIVGAGSAGAALAARLSEDPTVSVLLLEAGPVDKALELHVPAAFSKLFRGRYDWNYDTVPQPALEGRTVYWPRGKTLGGSSSLNAMMWVRGFAGDYDEWATVAGDTWSWRALAPLFRRVESVEGAVGSGFAAGSGPAAGLGSDAGSGFGPGAGSGAGPGTDAGAGSDSGAAAGTGSDELGPRPDAETWTGTDGPQRVEHQRDPRPHTAVFLQAARELGHPVTAANLPTGQGFSETEVTQRRGGRASTADAYLRPAGKRPNLRVVTGAHARRVTFAAGAVGEPPRATGVYVDIAGVTHHARATREVILCGGAINSPHLLMLSGIGPAEHLASHGIDVVVDAPGVGANLQDHLVAGLAPGARGGTLYGAEKPGQLASYLTRRRGMLTSNVAEAYGFVRTEVADETGAAADLPDIEIIFAPAPYVGEGLVPLPGEGLTVGAILLRPRSRGSIRLASADPMQAPLIDPAYLSDPDGLDARTLAAGLAECERLIATNALRAITTGTWIQPENGEALTSAERIELALRRYSHTLYHPVGTARMGLDEASVVDPELRVRGVRGLRVADASVIPTIIRGHTNAPAIVIGERAADLIRGA
ncbi:MAG: glucose-methanol-choline oxidoreductase [Microbacterium sp. SCN 70-27]|uniref:GMC family oxidoreductase n=1 Tax=unclassified Microbacterium TaxID=2609290 RepID=UPI00086F9B9A|nr:MULTISPECIES: GMC family oxidoreductase N-terminal domain-containing protein [unclassified Microbacterium]MBN9223790.1 GMC family oxidoreductase N-terminal domain-containing protein [Microbacterium sp.]ODT28822.1 MAG: glucose-methanol-choline oxidoreductase [Microbacterium sp. SCN 70-27]